ncbi:MAG: hypothetical protein JNL74_17095 [Fibrobacteres bacterium]|nr:hypothetical protein [Fibrobacterota bacterium]
MKIVIVYYVYINPKKKWYQLVTSQLNQLKATQILDEAELLVQICGPANLIPLCEQVIKIASPSAMIRSTTENLFEFHAIDLIWNRARMESEALFLYFHTKGMSHEGERRDFAERVLFQEVVEPWKSIRNVFESRSEITRAGYIPSQIGYIWFNFWWARGSYLCKCAKPELSDNRWYYEGWLATNSDNTNPSQLSNCYSLRDGRTGIGYTGEEAIQIMNQAVLLNQFP